jgi:type VI protein secretion system component Hcp
MTTTYYLVIHGVAGDYSDKLLTGAFKVSDFEFQTTNGSPGPGAGNTSTFDPLTLTLDSNSYAALLTDLGRGSVISGVSLIGETTGAGGTPLITYDLNLSNVVVTDLLKDTSSNNGVDLTLDYSKIGLVTSTVGSSGKTTTNPLSFGWDVAADTATGSGTELTSGGTAVGASTPTKYYLLIDGLNGGSTDKGHVGWFEISDFNIDASNPSNIQSGTGIGSGQPNFGDLSVTLQGDLAGLLADSASGAVLKGVKIEGVTANDTPVYDLEVANVLISKIDDTSTTAATIDFNYGQIGLTTKGDNGSGQFVQTGSSSWDVTENRPITGSLPALHPGTGTFSAGTASSYYLVIHGVAGDYSDKLLTGAFKVSDFDFLTKNGGTAQAGAAGNGGSTFDPLTLTLDSNSYTALLTDLGKGSVISGVSLIGETTGAGGTALITYDLNLSNVVVTDLSKDTSSNTGVDLTLDYGKIGLVTSTVGSGGKTTTNPQSFGWDVAADKATNTGTELTSGGTAVGASTPTKYYLLIDGFNGGSTDKAHLGWFEISNFSIDASSTSDMNGPGGGGGGKATFGDLSVTLQGDLAGLLADSAAGTHLTGVKIEGVTATDTPVYDLEVANVLIDKVDDTSTTAATIDFNYSQIGLTTKGQNSSGQFVQTGSSSWDVANQQPVTGSLPGLHTGGTFSAGAASSYYLVIHGVAGDYSDKLLTGAFKVSDFEFQTTNSGTSSFNPLTLTLDSNSYTALLTDLGRGTLISGVSLIGETTGAGGTALITYDLNLSNVVVTDLSKDTSSNNGVDLTLDYGKIGLVTSTVGSSGKTTTNPQSFGWDVAADQVTGSGTELTSGGTAVGASTPTKYYVLIDGFNGGSTDKAHLGWFEISDFNIDASATSNIQNGPGGGAGSATFGDLSITTDGDVALPSLLARSAPGTHLTGVKIEGVTANDTPVYDLEVANVLISKIDDTQTPGYSIDFNYNEIGLTTKGQNSSGQFVQTGSSSWDIANQQPVSGSLPALHVGPNAPCYCRDMLILTDRGEVPVQALAIGDVVVTMSGATRPIKWIGRRSYAGRFAVGQKDILPVCIRAGAIDENTPRRDLWISPHHAMYLEGVLIEARDLVNGVSIVQAETVDKVEYFHIELETHDVLVVEGSFSESFIDDDSRNLFHNAPEYRTLYPEDEQAAARYYAPRLDAGYAVEKARRHIEARAGLRAVANDNADALRGYVDQISSRRIGGWAQNPDHPEAPVCLDVYADGRLIGQTLANRYREDLQQAGLGSGRHSFEFTPPAGLTFAPDAVEVRRSFDGAMLSASYSARTNLAAGKREPARRTA